VLLEDTGEQLRRTSREPLRALPSQTGLGAALLVAACLALAPMAGCSISSPPHSSDVSSNTLPSVILENGEIALYIRGAETGAVGSPELVMQFARAEARRQGWMNGIAGTLILNALTEREVRRVVAPLTIESLRLEHVNWLEVDVVILRRL
jgi:hypothetical protein